MEEDRINLLPLASKEILALTLSVVEMTRPGLAVPPG
jgi:hypothetical protein